MVPARARRAIGTTTLTKVGAVSTSWGGASLSLFDEPWSVPFEDLYARQIAVNEMSRPSGVFGDYSEIPPKKGAQWMPLTGLPKEDPPKAGASTPPKPKIPNVWAASRHTNEFVRGSNVEGRDFSGVDLSGIRLEEVVRGSRRSS